VKPLTDFVVERTTKDEMPLMSQPPRDGITVKSNMTGQYSEWPLPKAYGNEECIFNEGCMGVEQEVQL